jgi:hypothetical protein
MLFENHPLVSPSPCPPSLICLSKLFIFHFSLSPLPFSFFIFHFSLFIFHFSLSPCLPVPNPFLNLNLSLNLPPSWPVPRPYISSPVPTSRPSSQLHPVPHSSLLLVNPGKTIATNRKVTRKHL